MSAPPKASKIERITYELGFLAIPTSLVGLLLFPDACALIEAVRPANMNGGWGQYR
jgi:hypothetical protein